jgi:hypothetical protein
MSFFEVSKEVIKSYIIIDLDSIDRGIQIKRNITLQIGAYSISPRTKEDWGLSTSNSRI